MQRYRFTLLLSMLFAMMVLSPLAPLVQSREGSVLAPLLTMLLFSLMLLSAVFAVATRRWSILLAGSLTAVEIAVHAANLFAGSRLLTAVQLVLGAVMVALTVALLLKTLFLEREVTFENIAASLCGYLLVGVLWSRLYLLLELIQRDAFSMPLMDAQSADELATSLYFSFVTLTTLGYGDITPVALTSRMLCTVEAITGQLYLAVLVARLVGLHIVQNSNGNPPRSTDSS